MPVDAAKACSLQSFFMGCDGQVVVLEGESTIIEKEGPGNRCSFLGVDCDVCFKTILAVAWRGAEVDRGVRIDCHKAASVLQAPGDRLTHRSQLGWSPGVVEQVGSNY